MSEGRQATDVLANEPTFLAYLRTAIRFIAFGFVVAPHDFGDMTSDRGISSVTAK